MRLVRDGGPRPLAVPGPLPLPGRPRRGRPFRVLVLGGARSGKSVTAERMLGNRDQVDYVACGLREDDTDPSWAERIGRHRERRPARWTTLETLDLDGVLAGPDRSAARQAIPVLVDCLSTWLAGVMDECGLWDGVPGRGQGAGRPRRRDAARLALDPAGRGGGKQRGRLGRCSRHRLGNALP